MEYTDWTIEWKETRIQLSARGINNLKTVSNNAVGLKQKPLFIANFTKNRMPNFRN